jgi:uncharacterized protein YjbI with pentapeptide repeats
MSMIKLSEILFEETRYKKETGKSLPNWQEKLKTYEQSKDYYVHFSNVPRANLYTINRFDTPIGFYAYPLDFDKMKNFAVDRPYAIVFKIKQEANILDLENYSINQYASDLAKLKTKYKISDEEIKSWEKGARNPTTAGILWNVTRRLSIGDIPNTVTEAYNATNSNAEPRVRKTLSPTEQEKRDKYVSKVLGSYQPIDPDAKGGGQTGKWSMILNKNLGYDGVIDNCLGIIHYSEPCQTVIFNTNIIEIQDIIQITKKIKTKDEISIVKTNYSNQDFSGKDLSRKNFSNAILIKTNLSNANLTSANLTSANLKKANLSGANLQGANLEFADFTGADLTNANFTGADLSGASLLDTNLSDTNLTNVKLSGANLNGVNLNGVNLKGSDLYRVNLYRADLTGANLTGANLEGAELYRADLTDADLTGTDLTRASLIDTNLSGANLQGANLTRANLTRVNLANANLTSANLKGAILIDASYNKNTKFPDNFNPLDKDMKNTD